MDEKDKSVDGLVSCITSNSLGKYKELNQIHICSSDETPQFGLPQLYGWDPNYQLYIGTDAQNNTRVGLLGSEEKILRRTGGDRIFVFDHRLPTELAGVLCNETFYFMAQMNNPLGKGTLYLHTFQNSRPKSCENVSTTRAYVRKS